MSRLGKQPVSLPNGVKARIENGEIKVEGPKGKLALRVPAGVEVGIEGSQVLVRRKSESAEHKAKHGLIRMLTANMVKGVSEGYERKLEIVGVGFKAAVKGKSVNFTLGYSHQIDFPLPEGVTAKVDANTQVTLTGADKALLGETAAKIRGLRPPEPYQGKGVLYKGEKIRRKAGKAAATAK